MIYDVFPYRGERDMLDIRMAELEGLDVVHVALESPVTSTGMPKSLHLRDDPVPGVRSATVHECSACISPRQREDHQRDAARHVLIIMGVHDDDWVIFGDVDEIVSVNAIYLGWSLQNAAFGGLVSLRMNYHSLLATWRLPIDEDHWNHRWPLLGRFGDYGESFHLERDRSEDLVRAVEDAGWHLSSMGGPDAVLEKVAAFEHFDEEWTHGLDADRLRDLAKRGRDVADRFNMEPVALDDLPRAIREDPDRYRHLLEVTW